MSRTRMPRVNRSLIALALMLLAVGAAGSFTGRAAEKDAEGTQPLSKSESTGKNPPSRKQRPAPPMKDLRYKDDDEDEAEEQIVAALSKPTEVNFVETPLEEALSFLKVTHKFNLWIDRQALNEAGIAVDTPVTLQVSEVRLESVLNLLLDSLRLEWLIQDEVLKITTPAQAAKLAETRTYDVQDLLDAGHSPEELIDSIVLCVEPETWSQAGGAGSIAHSGGVLVCRQSQRVQSAVTLLLLELTELAEKQIEQADSRQAPVITLKVYHTQQFPAEKLAETIHGLIAPDTWEQKGISLRAVPGALLVRQTPHVQREIEKLIRQLLPPAATPEDVPPTGELPASAEEGATGLRRPHGQSNGPRSSAVAQHR